MKKSVFRLSEVKYWYEKFGAKRATIMLIKEGKRGTLCKCLYPTFERLNLPPKTKSQMRIIYKKFGLFTKRGEHLHTTMDTIPPDCQADYQKLLLLWDKIRLTEPYRRLRKKRIVPLFSIRNLNNTGMKRRKEIEGLMTQVGKTYPKVYLDVEPKINPDVINCGE